MKCSPEAFNDAVAIIRRLGPEIEGVSRFEVQRVAYLACLLALYDGKPVADWGYTFIRSNFGAPFSADLNSALDWLAERSMMLISPNGRFNMRTDTARLSAFLSDRLSSRARFLLPACDSALMLPASTIAEGIDAEPTSQSAALQESGGFLLNNSARSLLYEQIEALRLIVGAVPEDLLTPSMLWMTYSARQPISRREETVA